MIKCAICHSAQFSYNVASEGDVKGLMRDGGGIVVREDDVMVVDGEDIRNRVSTLL